MSDSQEIPLSQPIKNRFRGYFPVIIDVETAGFDAKRCVTRTSRHHIKMDENGYLHPDQKCHFHIEPLKAQILIQNP